MKRFKREKNYRTINYYGISFVIIVMSKGIQTILQFYRYYDKIIEMISFFQVTLYLLFIN